MVIHNSYDGRELRGVRSARRWSLLSADPLKNIANAQKIDAVIINGRLLDRKAAI